MSISYHIVMTQASTGSKLLRLGLHPEEMDGKIGGGIGLVAPFDFALDDECQRWLPPSVPMFTTRTPELEDTTMNLTFAHEIGSELAVVPGVRSLLAVQPAAIGYACTSGSFVNGAAGEQHLREAMLKAGAPSAQTTSGALVGALQALGVQRLAIATPYTEDLTRLLVDYLRETGFEVVSGGYLDLEHDIARVNPAAVARLARAIDTPEAEALFFSCTNLHTFDIIAPLEAELGKPVLSANQVTIWSLLRAGGLEMPVINQRLFQTTV